MHSTAIPTFQLKAIPAWPILAACAAAAFFPAFQGTILSWDDQTYLADSAIQSTSCFWQRLGWIFSTSYFGNYNPLHRVGYWIQLSLWGRDPAPLHAVSVALHVANVLLVHALVRRLNFTVPVAFLTALLFAVHPSRAEVVAWISAQKDLGSTSLALIALCMYAPFLTGRPSRPIARHLAVAVFFLLALLYKSMMVTLPLVLFGLDLAWRRPPGRAFIEKLPLLAISAAFSLWTIGAAPRVGPVGGSWGSHTATMLKAPWAYLERILWPLDYSARWWIAREGGALSALSLAGLCCLLGGVLLLIIMLRSPHRRSAILWLWWPAACILPVSNLLPIPIEVADRYLYLALLGPFLAAASWCGGSGTASAARPLGCLAAAFLFALLSWRHAGAFRDAETVWRVSLEAQPDNPVARLHLANELLSSDRPSEALSLLGALHRDVLDRQECMVARAEALELLGTVGASPGATDTTPSPPASPAPSPPSSGPAPGTGVRPPMPRVRSPRGRPRGPA